MAVPGLTMINRLRRLTGESASETYTDADLTECLERYPLADADGYVSTDTAWAGNWDINQAAADVWEEKATFMVADFDFSADGGDYKRSQAYQQTLAIARMFRARRQSGTLTMIATPKPLGATSLLEYIGNLPEDDD